MNKDKDPQTISHIQKLKGITLSTTEAQQIRERLVSYTDLHTAHERAKSTPFLQSPFYQLLTSSYISHARAFTAAALVLVLVTGGVGVTFAAQDSLPGQPLYAVKVSIAEPLQSALITGTASKAHWHTILATRRLTEASSLAAENKLASSTQLYLQTEAATHIAIAEQGAEDLSASGDKDAATNVRSDLETKLAVHADTLTTLAVNLSAEGHATSTGAVLALLHQVDSERIHNIASANPGLTISETATSSAETPVIAIAQTQAEVQTGLNSPAQVEVKEAQITPALKATMFKGSVSLFTLDLPEHIASTTHATSTASTTPAKKKQSEEQTPLLHLVPERVQVKTPETP